MGLGMGTVDWAWKCALALGVWLAVCLVYILLLLLLVGRICVSVCDNIKWYNFHIKTEIPQEIFCEEEKKEICAHGDGVEQEERLGKAIYLLACSLSPSLLPSFSFDC